ncbi:hypothetical protein ACROYT_G001046 [Oculina patagonica]
MPSENILSHFWELASIDETTRLKAASQLLDALNQAQTQHDEKEKVEEDSMEDEENPYCDELEYSVTRLVKGLASSRKGARQGFATVLTEVLSEFGSLSPERVLSLIAKTLEVTGSSKAWEERDCYIGQIFGMMSVLRSQCEEDKISSPDTEWLGSLITRIKELSKKKSYLQELCAKVLVDILALVSSDVFIKCVYPAVEEILESGWTQATPETLLISLALQRCWGDHLDEKLMKGAWKCSFIAEKQNCKEMGTVLQDSISSHPRVHCVWDEIFLTLIDNPASDFELFWNTVIEDGLFQSTHDRKFLGFQLVKKVLPKISAKQVSVLFGGHMMRSFINSLSSSQSYLHEAAKQLASCLPALVIQNTDPEVPATVLQQLLGRQGNMHFDKLTKTRTVDNLLGTLKGSGPKVFVAWLLKMFECGFVEDSTETHSSAKSDEATQTAVLNHLYQLVKKKTVSHEGTWIQDVLFFFLENAYFQPIKTDIKVPLTSSVRQICGERFVSALKDLSSSKEMKQFELSNIVQHAKKLLEDEEYNVATDLWTTEAEKAFKKAVKSIEKIQKKRRKSEAPQHEDEVFQLLFSHMALNLFTEPDQAIDILKELKACYERQKTKTEEDHNEEPHWVEVLTEVLLSLLTRPSSLFRHVVDQVFTLLSPHLTRNALTMILESLDPRKGIQGETLEIVDESGDEEDDEEMEDQEGKGKEEANGGDNDNEGDKDDDDDDDDDEGSSSEDDQEEAVGVVDEAFRAEVQAALGSAMVDMEKEESSSDEDLDDEAMMKLDDALAAVFKSQLQAKKDKSKKKDSMKIVLHFKLRVLDIIEIFIKKQASNPLVLELIDPLLDVAWSSLNSKDFHTLGERAQGLFQNKLCSSKEFKSSKLDPQVTSDLRKAKASHFSKMFKEVKKTSAYWNLISDATNSRVHMKNIGPLKRSDGSLVVTDDEKAHLMNSHFALVGEKLAMALPLPRNGECQNAMDISNVPPQLAEITISSQSVSDKVNSLNTNKSPGPDSISPKLIKLAGNAIVPSLVSLYHESIKRGAVYSAWKIARLTPIYKKDDETDCGNYHRGTNTGDEPHGTFPCHRPRCRTCAHTNPASQINTPGGPLTIRQRFSCTTSNIVYIITCRACTMSYIGETGRRLGDRFCEHLRSVERKADLPVAKHFSSPGHTTDDMMVSVVRSGLTNIRERRSAEGRLIFKCRTLQPRGINIDFAFI